MCVHYALSDYHIISLLQVHHAFNFQKILGTHNSHPLLAPPEVSCANSGGPIALQIAGVGVATHKIWSWDHKSIRRIQHSFIHKFAQLCKFAADIGNWSALHGWLLMTTLDFFLIGAQKTSCRRHETYFFDFFKAHS